MPGKGKKITIYILDIGFIVDNILAGINQKQGTVLVGLLSHFFERKNCAQNIGHPRNGHKFGAWG